MRVLSRADSGGHGSEVDSDDTAPIRPGEDLNWPRVEAYLRSRLPELAGEFAVRQFPKGSANLTYRVHFGDTALVLRRPPFGSVAPGAHDMRREYRALSRLWQEYPRAPRALLFCDDHSVAGSDFLVVEYRPGIVVWDSVPAELSTDADAGRRVGLAVIDALADLHCVDPASCGLDDLGRPEGFLARQIEGWRRRWELAAGDDDFADARRLGALLADRLPSSGRPAVLHNDFKIDNCQFTPGNPDAVTSVFDWDMATLGDPLVDVGTLLNYWPNGDGPGPLAGLGVASLGLPPRDVVLARYAERSGRDVSDADWYEAYGCFKTLVIARQLAERYRRGETQDERMASYDELVATLAARGRLLCGRPGRPPSTKKNQTVTADKEGSGRP